MTLSDGVKSGPDLLCLGEPMVEFNAQPDGRWLYGFGGDVSNVAVAAARQGADVGMVTAIGQDSFGNDLLDLWDAEGVDVSNVQKVEGAPTGIYFVRHGVDAHTFEYRRAGSAASKMSPETVPTKAIRATRCLHLSGISQAISESALNTCDAAVEQAADAGTLVSFDPNLRLGLWSLEKARTAIHRVAGKCEFLLPGLDDARQLTGLTTPKDIIAYYLDLGAGCVALTLGAEGALVGDGEEVTHISGRPAQQVDANGAGDCFDGAFLARVLAGDDVTAAAKYAVAAASLSVQSFGAIAPIPIAAQVHEALAK